MCRALGVSKAGYYAWCDREPSLRAKQDAVLRLEIAAIHRISRETYGSPRVHQELRVRGIRCSRKRVARLMRTYDLVAKIRRRYKVCTTFSKHNLPIAQNLADRRFDITELNRLWVGDITYVQTDEGWLYLAALLDAASRRVIGWSCKDHLGTDIVLEPLRMALRERKTASGVIVHSDRGCQYASHAHRALLESNGFHCSMSRAGNCYDNAVAESFFATLKNELIYRRHWSTRREAQVAIDAWISNWYNRHRRHSKLGYLSPVEYELRQELQSVA